MNSKRFNIKKDRNGHTQQSMKGEIMQRQTYTILEVKEILGLGRDATYKLVKREGFPKIVEGRKTVIPKVAFEQWMNNQISM